MSITCLNIIRDLNKSVEKANFEVINNMTQSNMIYEWVCIKPDTTYDFFYKYLKNEWEQIIDNFINHPDKCSTRLSELVELYNFLTPERIQQAKEIINALKIEDEAGKHILNIGGVNINNIVLDVIATSLMKPIQENNFEMKPNFFENITDLGKIMVDNCKCQIIDIFKTFIKKYKLKYHTKLLGKSKADVIEILREDYEKFKKFLKNLSDKKTENVQKEYLGKLATKFTGIYGFSVEKELDKLIPEELGSLKEFFIIVISKYYDNLHPIIWAQIFKSITENVFIDLPFTPDEIFSFISKYLLLNSGPFILKILQLIRPVLSPELAKKYNLTKLTYPLLKPEQIELVLSKSVYEWDMYNILENFSASVGHVCKVVQANNPTSPFMIKIIKPIAVAQSCWEYKTLYDIFKEGTCEQIFIKKMLESNGRELNVNNEISNVNKGYQCYNANYKDIFGVELDAILTTIQNIPNIIKPNIWYAMTMTLAPGIPLSKLVEEDLINKDTKYRAKLHRCLDILVYKFFLNIVQNGFYHGDLHAGNIFFSFENKQMTLIDFGAVGEINLYENTLDVNTLLDIIIMSIFSNFDEMFDVMTKLLNSKCIETQIDMTTTEYQELKQTLFKYREQNIRVEEKEKEKQKIYEYDIFSKERIEDETENENQYIGEYKNFNPNNIDSIYAYLEYKPKGKETIIENRDDLPPFTNVGSETESISFPSVLEKIIKFYALSGVNIAIKFSEFYEFQKAYALLLGVLHKVGYNPYRSGIAIGKAIVNWGNIKELMHLSTVIYVTKKYWEERNKHNELKEKLFFPAEQISSEYQKSMETVTSHSTSAENKPSNNDKSYYLMSMAMAQDLTIPESEEEYCIQKNMTGGDVYYLKKYLKYKTKYYGLMMNS